MEFEQIVNERYATKTFDGRKIDSGQLDRILDMTRLAPSAINLQPWKVKIVSDDKVKQALLPYTMGQQQITTCSVLLVFCADTDLQGHAIKILNGMKAAGTPVDIVKGRQAITANYISRMTPEQRLCEAQKNTFLAAMTAIYAAKSLGIDSCPMAGFDPAGYAKLLKLPSSLVPTLLVPLGYPADKPGPKIRFPREEVFF